MKGFKDPGFQDRAAASARAKSRAVENLKVAPKPDEAELAARAARQLERESKAAAKRAEKEEAQRLKREAEVEAEAERARAEGRTEAERKAARDARYAARKKRKA